MLDIVGKIVATIVGRVAVAGGGGGIGWPLGLDVAAELDAAPYNQRTDRLRSFVDCSLRNTVFLFVFLGFCH